MAGSYARHFGVESAKAWLHVNRFLREAERRGFVSQGAPERSAYPGRGELLRPRLRELWIHTNNSCNLSCNHCLVSSGPDGDKGLDGESLLGLIDEAADAGVERFFFTGGEPFYRRDVFDLVERVTRHHQRELTILSNGILFRGEVVKRLRQQDPGKLRLQVSLDGASAESNDPVRRRGSFDKILTGVRNLVEAGFAPTISTVVAQGNVDELPAMARLVKQLGASGWHLLWIHKKGRWESLEGGFVEPELLHERVSQAQKLARELGVQIDPP